MNSIVKTERTLDTTRQLTRKTKVAIIGAGIAGLGAAKTFEDANFKEYLLIEAQKHIGGRIQSLPWGGNWIECGAQFLHGDRSKLAELCYQHKLLSEVQFRDGEGIFIRDDNLEIEENVVMEIDDLIRTVLEECELYENQNVSGCESIGRILRARFKKHLRLKNDSPPIRNMKHEIYDWCVRFLMIDNACRNIDELSAKYWGKFKYVGGPEHLLFKEGYNSLTKLIADHLNEKNLCLNTAVELIEWQQNFNQEDHSAPVVLTLSDKTQVLCDSVIVTCSLGYLKEYHKTMFAPILPLSLRLGIESLGFGLINKIFLDFGTPWWEPGTKGFQLVWRKTQSQMFLDESLAPWTRDITGFDVLSGHEGVLLGWVGGQGAYIIETLSKQQVSVDCTNVLKCHLKLDNIPPVKRCLRTQWHSNKYVRGSYSHISTKCDGNGVTPATLATPVWSSRTQGNCTKDVPIIMLAGEATHESYYSTTHGAYDTGVKQAQTFLRHHSASS